MAIKVGVGVGKLVASGTFDITDASSLGGDTPVGAVILATYGVTQNTRVVHSGYSMGFVDGTTENAVSGNDEDNVSPSDSHGVLSTSRCLNISDPGVGNNHAAATFASFIANGVRLTRVASDSLVQVTAILFAGGTAYVESNTLANTGSGETNVITHSLNSSNYLVFAISGPTTNFGTNFGFGSVSGGVINQSCLGFFSQNGASTTSTQSMVNDGFIQMLDSASVASNDRLSISAADANTITLLNDEAIHNADEIQVLIVDVGDRKCIAGSIDSFTNAAVDWVVTDPGFKPQAVGLAGCMATVNNTPTADNSGFHGAFTAANTEQSVLWTSEDGVGVSNSGSESSDNAIDMLSGGDDAPTVQALATFAGTGDTAMTTNGWTFDSADITTAPSSALKWMYWAVEEEAAGATSYSFANMHRSAAIRSLVTR